MTTELMKNCTYRSLPHFDYATLAYPLPCFKIRELTEILLLLKKYFEGLDFKITKKPKSYTAQTEGIFIRIYPYSLSIQFQGAFFVLKERAFEKLRLIACELSFLINTHFEFDQKIKMHLCRLDVAQCFFNLVPKYFRNPMMLEHYFTFAAGITHFEEMKKGMYLDTGYLIKNSYWEISCYRQDIENKKQKNKDKKMKVLAYIGNDVPVTKFEVRLLSYQNCLLATLLLYTPNIDETELCKQALNEFYQHRKFRIPNDKDTHKDRWEENIIWKDLFIFDKRVIKLSQVAGVTKNEIKLNDLIAVKTLTGSFNNVAMILDKYEKNTRDEILTKAWEKAQGEVEKRKIISKKKKTKTDAFYRRLSESEEPV